MASLEEVFPEIKKEREEKRKRDAAGYFYKGERKHPGLCPICGEEPKSFCNCTIGSLGCQNGHEWHMKGNQILEGNGH